MSCPRSARKRASPVPLACRARVKRGGDSISPVCTTSTPDARGSRTVSSTSQLSGSARPAASGSEGVLRHRGRRRPLEMASIAGPADADPAVGTNDDTTVRVDPHSRDASAAPSARGTTDARGTSKRKREDGWRTRVQIAASKVAAICGLGHPNATAELPDYILALVYAGNRQQLERDADLLGLQLVDDDQALASLISKLDAPDKFTATLQRSESDAVHSRSQVQGAIAETQKVVEEAKALGKLSNAEAQTLKAQVRSRVSTSFGTRHESAALRLYESVTGTKVRGENDTRYTLRLDTPAESSMSRPSKRHQLDVEVVGYVDGIADHLVPDETAPDGDEWTTQPRVIEIKNRVGSGNRPPPFYDEVQCVAYMHMLGLDVCDLVEVYKEDGPSVGDGEAGAAAGSRIRVHTIPLHGPPAHHSRNWKATVDPRLREVGAGVQAARLDDHLRYRLLYSLACDNADAVWDILCEMIPSYSDIRPL